MASISGKITFEAGGESYVFQLGANAICEIEDRYDCAFSNIGSILSNKDKPARIQDIRSIFQCGLMENWPDGQPTIEQAGLIMTQIGLPAATQLIFDGLKAAFPDATVTKAGQSGPGGKAPRAVNRV
jgi:hypothetical protein